MIRLFKALSMAAALFGLCHATDLREHVVPLQSSTFHFSFPPTVQEVRATGICIDPACSVIATAHHAQMLTGRAHLGVPGYGTARILSPSNESDAIKTAIPVGNTVLSYNPVKDIAFIYTRKPIPHKSGLPHSYSFHLGDRVQVAGYYGRKFTTREARIIGVNAPLLAGGTPLKENLVLDASLEPGFSGSAVVDQQGNLLGMIILSGTVQSQAGSMKASVALPIQAVAKILTTLDPSLGASVFGDIPEDSVHSSSGFSAITAEDEAPEETPDLIPQLSPVPEQVADPVSALRAKAKAASKAMIDLLAKQCLVQGTGKPICHEVSVVDGQMTFRAISKKGKLGAPSGSFPALKHGVWPQTDWTDTWSEIAGHPWIFQGSVQGGYLFTFKSAAENDRCEFEEHPQEVPLFGGGHQDWTGSVACFEQIVTDKEFNILAVFVEITPPDPCLTQLLQIATYYDWVAIDGLASPILLPVAEKIAAKVEGQKNLLYASVQWSDYQQFRVVHKIKF